MSAQSRLWHSLRRTLRVAGAPVCLAGSLLLAGVFPAGALASANNGLAAAFDNVGISTPNGPAADFDGVGDSFSAAGLAADALAPGAVMLHDGLAISWPHRNAAGDDNVLADGQTIALNGRGNTLGVVAAADYAGSSAGVGGKFVVSYANGTATTATLHFADWADNAPSAGTDLLATSEGEGSGLRAPVALYYGSIALDPDKPVRSVTLPTVGDSVAKGLPALHIFDLTVGTVGSDATGAPGSESYYDEGRKDCVGTAADTQSKVWYTVADGTLSDVYGPTIDNTNVKSLDPIVTGTDGGVPFTDLQPRNMTYKVSQLDRTGMACRVIALPKGADPSFAIVSDFITNPTSDAVVMRESLVTLPGAPGDLHVYLRFNPLLNGHGGGGSENVGGQSATVVHSRRDGQIPVAYSTNSFTQAINRTYAAPIYAALSASSRFADVETGYVGSATDGLTELDNGQKLTSTSPDANNGNVVQTVELSLNHGHDDPRSGGLPAQATGRASDSQLADARFVVDADGVAAAVAKASGRAVSPAAVSSTTVALGFGRTERGAIDAAERSSRQPFARTYERYEQQWLSYDARLHRPPNHVADDPGSESAAALAHAYWLSANVLKASEDKTFIGDTAASLASPWGQAVAAGNGNGSDNLATYFGSYREVFPRDAYETFTGFLADGDMRTARQMVRFWFDDLQLPNGAFPRNGLVNGKAAPDTGGLQLDETADPILAAWQAGFASDRALYEDHIKPAADFLVANGPETTGSVERWEEQNGYSPSTIADEVAGLVAASAIAHAQGDDASARVFAASADDFRALALKTTIVAGGTSPTGKNLPGPYFIRVSKTGDPNSDPTYEVGNGNTFGYQQDSVLDQGFLELVRLGELTPLAPAVQNTLALLANPQNGSGIDVATPSGIGVLRYTGDGYGDCYPASNDIAGVTPDDSPANQSCPSTGAPWAEENAGTGHPWPVLSGENAEYQILHGETAAAVSDLRFMLSSASGVGLVPEQVWDDPAVPAAGFPADPASGAGADPASLTDPASASIGFADGQADGSAAPLTWAQAQELRLIVDLGDGTVQDQPSIVAQRYAGAGERLSSEVPLTVTAPLQVSGGNVPADMTRPSVGVDGTSTTVTGTTAPGAIVDVAVTPDPSASGTTTASAVGTTSISTTAATTGEFSVPVTLAAGANSVEVTATTGSSPSDTNEALLTVVDTLPAGTLVMNAQPGPDGGSGPGTYQYPPSAPFPPDTFKLTSLKVVNSANGTTTIQVGIANMQPIYGSLLGGQLLDVYIHAPAADVPNREQQSTGPATNGSPSSAPQDNYTIAPDAAWNQLIQLDGFGGEDWVTPSSAGGGLYDGTSVGTPNVSFTQLGQAGNGEIPGLIDIAVPNSVLGTPGPGWTFTVTLAGQDGFNATDLARFSATPVGFDFGVCSTAVASEADAPAICSQAPGTVPNIMDTIPPVPTDSVQAELTPGAGDSSPALAGPSIG